jgi:hypothetical protein
MPVLLVAVAGGFFFMQRTGRIHLSVPSVVPTAAGLRNSTGPQVAMGNLSSAELAMQTYFTEHETYVGATMPDGTGTVIVRADPTSFCLQYQTGSTLMHLAGPSGQALSGPC